MTDMDIENVSIINHEENHGVRNPNPASITFINLPDGITCVSSHTEDLKFEHFLRIDSRDCEKGRWSEIILSLSDDFLFHMALGFPVNIVDYDESGGIPAFIRYGVPFIIYATSRAWFGTKAAALHILKELMNGADFDVVYDGNLSNKAKDRLLKYRETAQQYITEPFNVEAWCVKDPKDSPANSVRLYHDLWWYKFINNYGEDEDIHYVENPGV